LVGQDEAVRALTVMGKAGEIPHCLLLSGPSGCGKTTIARILKAKLKCSDFDFAELNIADLRGIDMVRSIRDRMGQSPIGGATRIWLLDEVARATTDAQNAFLKMLEDTPPHVYFILCTTEPQKLLETIRTRATEVKVRALREDEMAQLLQKISALEDFHLSEEVQDKIVALAEGSPRKALVLLNQVIGLKEESEQLAAVSAGVASSESIELARALMNTKVAWASIAKLLQTVQEDPEALRRMILGYCGAILLKGGNNMDRAYSIISCFERAFYDSGKPGLVASCFEVVCKQ
jgi:DNA polymerase-3 subunit gamma/tau